MINQIFLRGKYIAMIKKCFCITINCNSLRAQRFFLSFHMNDIFGSIKHVSAFQLVVFISEHTFVSLSFHMNDSFGMIKRVFLDASSHLYKRVCPSVGRSVRPSVRNQLFSKSKNEGF